jgi:hypothetical protein
MDRKSQRREHRGARVPPGTVALLCAGHARYTQVLQCFMALDLPPGTRTHIYGGGVDVPHNRNEIVSTFQGDWLLMIDDDQLFTPDLAMRLLRRLDQPRVDVVVPLILRRGPPHEPVLELLPTGATELVRVKLTDESGLLPVYAAGTGIVLIRRRVFERIGEPWFERHPQVEQRLLLLRPSTGGRLWRLLRFRRASGARGANGRVADEATEWPVGRGIYDDDNRGS